MMLRRREMMGSKGGGLALHWDYTMGSPLDYGFVASVIEGQAEMQDGGFFLSASSTSACVNTGLMFPISDIFPDFEMANGFEINVKFKIVKDNGWSELVRIDVFDKNNVSEYFLALSMYKQLRISSNKNFLKIGTFPSVGSNVTQKFVMKDGKLAGYFNELALENVNPTSLASTKEPCVIVQICNNWYNKGTSSVLIESIDITLNKGVA